MQEVIKKPVPTTTGNTHEDHDLNELESASVNQEISPKPGTVREGKPLKGSAGGEEKDITD